MLLVEKTLIPPRSFFGGGSMRITYEIIFFIFWRNMKDIRNEVAKIFALGIVFNLGLYLVLINL